MFIIDQSGNTLLLNIALSSHLPFEPITALLLYTMCGSRGGARGPDPPEKS